MQVLPNWHIRPRPRHGHLHNLPGGQAEQRGSHAVCDLPGWTVCLECHQLRVLRVGEICTGRPDRRVPIVHCGLCDGNGKRRHRLHQLRRGEIQQGPRGQLHHVPCGYLQPDQRFVVHELHPGISLGCEQQLWLHCVRGGEDSCDYRFDELHFVHLWSISVGIRSIQMQSLRGWHACEYRGQLSMHRLHCRHL